MSWHVGSWDELVELREELVVEGLGTHAINVLDPLVMIGERAGHVVDRAVEVANVDKLCALLRVACSDDKEALADVLDFLPDQAAGRTGEPAWLDAECHQIGVLLDLDDGALGGGRGHVHEPNVKSRYADDPRRLTVPVGACSAIVRMK